MTFTQIVTDICGRMNLVSAEAIARVGAAVNRHYRRVTATIGLEPTRFITRTAQTAIDSDQVTFAGIEKIDRVFERDADGTVRVLRPVWLSQLREAPVQPGIRTTYAIAHQTATDITILLPGPALAVADLWADGWSKLADLAGTDEPGIPASFHDILTFEVVAEEYLRKGNTDLADRFKSQADALLKELRFHIADAPAIDFRQADHVIHGEGGGASGGSGSSVITGDITFDRDPGPPFHVTPGSAKVDNLDADKLDGQHGAFYQDLANATGTLPLAQLPAHHATHQPGGSDALTTLDAGILLTGTLPAARIAADSITNDKLANLPAANLLGRGSLAGAGDPEPVTIGSGLQMAGTVLQASGGAAVGAPGGLPTQVQFNDAGVLNGDAGMVYDKATDKLTVGSIVGNGSGLTGLPASAPGGATTQVQFNDAGSFAGIPEFAINKTTKVLALGGDIAITSAAAVVGLRRATADGADTGIIAINGGGAQQSDRGGGVVVGGNESTLPGKVMLVPGVPAGVTEIYRGSDGALAVTVQANGTVAVVGTVAAGAVTGDGSGLTNLNGTNIATGTVPDARLSANVALRNANNTFTAPKQQVSAGTPRVQWIDTAQPADQKAFEIVNSSQVFAIQALNDAQNAVSGSVWLTRAGVLTLGNGKLNFPTTMNASADPNTLDDYREGSFTPFIGSTGGQSGQVYAAQVGRYVKVGQKVSTWGWVALSVLGTMQFDLIMGGFPFTSLAVGGPPYLGTVRFLNLNMQYASIYLVMTGASPAPYADIAGVLAGGSGNHTNVPFGALSPSTHFIFQLEYLTGQ